MGERPADTSPEAWELVLRLARDQTPARKLSQVNELTKAARRMALAGLRRRYPGATQAELRARLAALLLDRETVQQAYAWDPAREGY